MEDPHSEVGVVEADHPAGADPDLPDPPELKRGRRNPTPRKKSLPPVSRRKTSQEEYETANM